MNIIEALCPIQPVFNVCNLSCILWNRKNWTLKTSKWLSSYTTIVLFVSFAFFIYGFFEDGDFNNTSNDDISETVDFIQMVGIRLAHIVSITEVMMRRLDEQAFYVKVKEIDGMFESKLNAAIDNGALRWRIYKHGLITLAVYLGTELAILAAKLLAANSRFSVFWVLYTMPFLICGIRYFQIYIAVAVIGQRLDKLVEVLDKINLQDAAVNQFKAREDAFRLISNNLHVLSVKHRHWSDGPQLGNINELIAIKDIYNRLWELHGIVNRFIGLSMLINIANDFISITSNCYWIFVNFKAYSSQLSDLLQIIASAIWTVPHLFNVLITALVCDRTAKGTTRMALSLHNIQFDIFNENHNTLIEQFSMQLLHQKFAFTAAGFFKINCSLLYTIVGATTTYLIILIQFHMSEGKSVQTQV